MKDLYLISTETLQFPATIHRHESGKEDIKKGCIIKIGESTDVYIRVETLDGTFVFEIPIILKIWKNSPLTDKQVHIELEKRGFIKYREDKDREFFEWESQEQAIREVNDILYGTKKLKTYSEREEQTMIINGVCELFKLQIGRREKRKIIRALVNAKMRSGKCHISYKIAKKMKFKKVLILTYKPRCIRKLGRRY